MEEDNKKLNLRGLATFWELIQAWFRPITDSEIDAITGVELVNADDVEY